MALWDCPEILPRAGRPRPYGDYNEGLDFWTLLKSNIQPLKLMYPLNPHRGHGDGRGNPEYSYAGGSIPDPP
jgi:hypothetical protein